MSGAAMLLAGLAALPGPGSEITCRFDQACIDRRPCFDSAATVQVTVLEDGLAVLEMAPDRRRPALIRREGVWTSVITAPDLDHANRVEVLDWADDGQATLVVSTPGSAVEMLSRSGRCDLAEEMPQ